MIVPMTFIGENKFNTMGWDFRIFVVYSIKYLAYSKVKGFEGNSLNEIFYKILASLTIISLFLRFFITINLRDNFN